MKIDIQYYLLPKDITYYDRINYLKCEKMVLYKVLVIILQELEFNHIIICLQKKTLTFHNVIILVKSIANKNENNYYYNTFLGKGSYEDESNTYFLNKYLYVINTIFRWDSYF